MNYIEHINSTLLLKKQLNTTVQLSNEWAEIEELIVSGETHLVSFPEIYKELNSSLSRFNVELLQRDNTEINKLYNILSDTIPKLQKIQELCSNEIPFDTAQSKSRIAATTLMDSWDSSTTIGLKQLRLAEVDEFMNKIEENVETAAILSEIAQKIEMHHELCEAHNAFLSDIESRIAKCALLAEAKLLSQSLDKAIPGLSEMSNLREEIRRILPKLEVDDFQAVRFLSEWKSFERDSMDSMVLTNVEEHHDMSIQLLSVARGLVKAIVSIQNHKSRLSRFLGVVNDLSIQIRECSTEFEADELQESLSIALEGVATNESLEKKFKDSIAQVTAEDKKIIEELFYKAQNETSCEQLKRVNSRLDGVISATDANYRNKKNRLLKIGVGVISFIPFAYLMSKYIVPFLNEINGDPSQDVDGAGGSLIWLAPITFGILITLHKKEVIFKR